MALVYVVISLIILLVLPCITPSINLIDILKKLTRPEIIDIIGMVISLFAVFLASYLTSKTEQQNFKKQRQFEIENQIFQNTHNQLEDLYYKFAEMNSSISKDYFEYYNFVNQNIKHLVPSSQIDPYLNEESFSLKYDSKKDIIIQALFKARPNLRQMIHIFEQQSSKYEQNHPVYINLQSIIYIVSMKISSIESIIYKIVTLQIRVPLSTDELNVVFLDVRKVLFIFSEDNDDLMSLWNDLLSSTSVNKVKYK